MMIDIVLTQNEIRIIEALRSLKPYEELVIVGDAKGRPDSFLLKRSTKVLLVFGTPPEPKRL